jgi:hypothetical protein
MYRNFYTRNQRVKIKYNQYRTANAFSTSSPGISNLKFGGRLLFFESMLEINYSSVSMG